MVEDMVNVHVVGLVQSRINIDMLWVIPLILINGQTCKVVNALVGGVGNRDLISVVQRVQIREFGEDQVQMFTVVIHLELVNL